MRNGNERIHRSNGGGKIRRVVQRLLGRFDPEKKGGGGRAVLPSRRIQVEGGRSLNRRDKLNESSIRDNNNNNKGRRKGALGQRISTVTLLHTYTLTHSTKLKEKRYLIFWGISLIFNLITFFFFGSSSSSSELLLLLLLLRGRIFFSRNSQVTTLVEWYLG